MSDRSWFVSRMLAHAAGLLNDEELERFELLRSSDSTCAAQWEEFVGDDPPIGEFHLPAGMIAHWPAAADSLGALERRAVEEHLSRCESCAEEIALFGSATRTAARSHEPRRVGTPTPRRDQWRIALSGGIVGALATAAVLVLLLQPAPTPQSGGALPWAAPTRVRSDQLPAFARVTVDAQARQIGLNLAVPQAVDPSRPAEILVFRPDDTLLQRFDASSGEIGRGALLLLLSADRSFESGSYRVLFAQDEQESELWFEVERPAN